MDYIFTHLLFTIVCVFLINNEGVNSKRGNDSVGAILPYWVPDPRFDFRRQDFGLNETNLSRHVKHTDQAKKKVHRHAKTATALGNTKFRSKQQRVKKDALKFLRNVNYSRALRLHSEENHKPESKSTRIAPMSLMQQEEMMTENQDKNPFILNPYSVGEQFSKLLSELTDADVETEILERTASYNNILLFKIFQKGSKVFRADDSRYVENDPKERKILFIVHALSTMGLDSLFTLTTEKFLKKLLSYYLEHLDKFDIYLMPLANPDGLIMTRKNKYWNKNASPNADCSGVDVDRNFDVAWNSTAEISSCSQHYPGPAPFSEPESRAVRDVLHSTSHKIVAYFHVHAGTYNMDTFKGDALLYPTGFTEQQSDDDKYMDLKGEIDEAIKNANFKVLSVTVDSLYNWYGPVTGTSVDYAATVYGIPYAMEMVMQVYQNPLVDAADKLLTNEVNDLEYLALTEIWRRVIDVTFKNIYKNLDANEA